MWSKLKTTYAGAIVNVITRTALQAAIDNMVDESANSTVEFLKVTSPPEIVEFANSKKTVTSTQVKNNWIIRLRRVLAGAKKIKVIGKENIPNIIKVVNSYDSNQIIPLLLEKARDEAIYGDESALKNLGFIINDTACKEWLISNMDEVKKIVVSELELAGR
jgi:hypothetical protein